MFSARYKPVLFAFFVSLARTARTNAPTHWLCFWSSVIGWPKHLLSPNPPRR